MTATITRIIVLYDEASACPHCGGSAYGYGVEGRNGHVDTCPGYAKTALVEAGVLTEREAAEAPEVR
jgi:hypothetical protein